jgi:hypothetical protein
MFRNNNDTLNKMAMVLYDSCHSSGLYNYSAMTIDDDMEYSNILSLLVHVNNLTTFKGIGTNREIPLGCRLLLACGYTLHFPIDVPEYLPDHLSPLHLDTLLSSSPYFIEDPVEYNSEPQETWTIIRNVGSRKVRRYRASNGQVICPTLYELISEISWKELSRIHKRADRMTD